MHLSDLQLSYLTSILPHMKLSHVMKMAQDYDIRTDDLMSIRTAGRLKIAAYAHEKELEGHKPNQFAKDVATTVIEKVKEIAKAKQQQPLYKVKSALSDGKDKNQIAKEILDIEK